MSTNINSSYETNERRLKYYYRRVKGGWVENRPFFMDDFEYKKMVLVKNGIEALTLIEKTRIPAEHAGLLKEYIKCLVRIQKSEKWVAMFEANKTRINDRKCKARPKPRISAHSTQIDQEIKCFFRKACVIIGMEAIKAFNVGNIGEMKINISKTATGGVIFEMIQE